MTQRVPKKIACYTCDNPINPDSKYTKFCSVKCYTKNYNKKNSKRLTAISAAWRKNNPEQSRKRKKEWADRNPDKVREAKAKWRENNREKSRNSVKNTYWKNPEKSRIKKRNVQSRRRSSEKSGNITAEQWEAIKSAAKNKCHYCKKKRKLTMDHVIPLAKGGAHTPSNVVPACRPCNSSKGAKLIMFI